MPVNPNLLERLWLLRLNRGPGPVLDLFGAASFEAVTLALDVGVFEALAGEPGTVDELADRLGAHADGLRALLEFLAAQGFVAEGGGRYRNTPMTTSWLLADSSTNVAPWLTFWAELVLPFWAANLETAVREGEPPLTIYEWFDEAPARWETAQRGFRAAASVAVDEVMAKLDVPAGDARLLDVGGGHGLYAVELCRAHPALSATVFDVPAALDVARREIDAAGLADRVDVVGGDYLSDPLGDGYDVALVFNVVHAHDGEANRRLLERVAAALRPGGRVAVLDQLAGSARTSLGRTALGFVGLTYRSTLGAELHRYEDVLGWLRAAGFEDVRRTSIQRAGPGNTLVEATKAGG